MRIKRTIKVKHLVLFLLVFLAVSASAVFVRMLSTEEVRMEAGGAESILEGLAEIPNGARKWALIREFLIEPGAESIVEDADIIIGPGGMSERGGVSHGEAVKIAWREKQPYLEQYAAEAPIDAYLMRAVRQLAYYYGSYGQPGEAVRVLEQAEKRLVHAGEKEQYKGEINGLRQLRAEWLYRQGEAGKAERLLNELRQAGGSAGNALVRSAVMLKLEQGRLQEALTELGQHLQMAKTSESGWRSVNEEQLAALQKQLQRTAAGNTGSAGDEASFGEFKAASISGVIRRSDGTPIAGAGIFLRFKEDLYHSVVEGEPYQTMSDPDGRFELRGVLPGSYQLYAGLQYEQIDGFTWAADQDEWLDVSAGASLSPSIVLTPLSELEYPVNGQSVTEPELEFRWRPVEGAEYYQLEGSVPVGSGSIGIVIRSYVHDHKVKIPLQELYDALSGIIVYEGQGDEVNKGWKSADPQSLLGFANPESRFAWSVKAYGADGRLLTRSGGYRLDEDTVGELPFFYLQARTLTPADRLLLDGKHEEALAAYRAAYGRDTADVHSLRMLIRLLSVKTSWEKRRAGTAGTADAPEAAGETETLGTAEEAWGTGTAELAESPAEQEIFQLRLKLLELAPTPGLLNQLMDDYYEKRDWPKYAEAVEEYKRLAGEQLNSYQQAIYAAAWMRQGKLDEAAAAFESAMQMDRSHRYIGSYLAVLLARHEKLEPALAAAAKYPERSVHGPQHDWPQLLMKLQQEKTAAEQEGGKEAAAYREELKKMLDMYMRGDLERVREWAAGAASESLAALADALLEVW